MHYLNIGEHSDTPPGKRRRLVPVVPAVTPTKLSELLSVFGARKTPTSVSRMDRDAAGHSRLRGRTAVSSAQSPASSEPNPPEAEASSQRVLDTAGQAEAESESEDELAASDDVIHAVPRGAKPPAPELPVRPRRLRVTYARHVAKPAGRNKSMTKRKPTKRIITSDTSTGISHPNAQAHAQTARGKVRRDIALHTKPKRDAFLLANRDYFVPLLPSGNYISKLERAATTSENGLPKETSYIHLQSQPLGVQAIMKPYQLSGLSFLVHMYENGMSAILGDEMGLGKTLQTLSLFQYLEENKQTAGELRPYLVVCPLSVLQSWISEAKKWVPSLNLVRFHGPKTERERLKTECTTKKARYERGGGKNRDDRMDVFVTTYETFLHEQGWFKRNFVWRYCVLDEGHKIKNNDSDIASALQGLSAEFRLLLTGTPLQNNLKEMWALLHWLFPDVFTDDTSDAFRKAFDLAKGNVSTSFMDDARQLLELIMLRRMKTSPGVDLGLPEKEEVALFVPLTPTQRFWYRWLLNGAGDATLDDIFADAKAKEAEALHQGEDMTLATLEGAGQFLDHAGAIDSTDIFAESRAIMQQAIEKAHEEKKGRGWRKLMNLLMQLRKACNHPYLLANAAPHEYTIGNHVVEASSKFIVLDKLLRELVVKQGKKVLIFSGFTSMLNLCEELFMLQNASGASIRHSRLDGGTSRAQRNLSIRLFNDMKSDYNVMLLSTRAGGLGINLTSATDVVFLDEDFNPQVTLQAEARAHRIGQTKKVTVYKICTQGTVEEQMMGRIRKKLYLSAKITESMRNIHTAGSGCPGGKRKRTSSAQAADDDAPHLDTASLQALIRRGAQTLARDEIKVEELVSWDWHTILEKCKDQAVDASVAERSGNAEVDEQAWLSKMERVQTAVFEGKKHAKEIQKEAEEMMNLNRADRRLGKNTTVEVDGYMINKGSLNCADWEAVPTFAGKDPSLAEYKKVKKAAINNQEFCQACWEGGQMTLCSGCPRSYHVECLSKDHQLRAKSKMQYTCPQHECHDCGAKTGDAGGLIYRCRWCTNGFCEQCLDWDEAELIGDTLPEYEVLGFGKVAQAFFVECHDCVGNWKVDERDRVQVEREKARIQANYEQYLDSRGVAVAALTPDTVSEIATPAREEDPFSGRADHTGKPQSQTVIDLTSDLTEFTSDTEHATIVGSPPRSTEESGKAGAIGFASDLIDLTANTSSTIGVCSSPRSAKKVRR